MTPNKFAGRLYTGFPPKSQLIMLPSGPTRAALASLALYEAVEPTQRAALAGARSLLRTGLHFFLPRVQREVDWDWWQRWVAEVAEPIVGPVEHIALRVPDSARVCVLLMDSQGQPLGFAKVLDNPQPELSTQALQLLTEAKPKWFRVPAVLAEGSFGGVQYHLSEALPEGSHRRPPHDPPKIRHVLDEFTSLLSTLPRSREVPEHYVICHTGFTPRNLRVDCNGAWWLFDLDNVRWGPRLAPELRYWAAEFAYRWRPRVERDAARVLALLRDRGSDPEIREAVHWTGHTRTYRKIEREVHLHVAELARE